MFLPLFSGEMVGITLNSMQIHRKKPLCAKFKVTYIGLVYTVGWFSDNEHTNQKKICHFKTFNFFLNAWYEKVDNIKSQDYVEVVKLVFILFCKFSTCKAEWKWGNGHTSLRTRIFLTVSKTRISSERAEPNTFYGNEVTWVLLEYREMYGIS